MVSTYTHATALKVYTAIANSGDRGVDLEQLMFATGLAGNTLRTYARWLEDDTAISISEIHSEAPNKPLKNLYLAIREPRPRVLDQDRLKKIVEILEPFSKHPSSWDKEYKGEIINAVQSAINTALE